VKEEHFCYSLTGVSLPILTVTSKVERCSKDKLGAPVEIDRSEFTNEAHIPPHKYKKYMVVCARVHPGETNSSFIMQGFIEFITG